MNTWGKMVPSCWPSESIGPIIQLLDISVCSGAGFARNAQLRGNTCLVCCFPWLCIINLLSFSFYDIFAWVAIRRVLPPERIGVPDSKDHKAFLVLNTDWGVRDHSHICNSFMTILWCPWVGYKRASRSKCTLVWLPIERPPVRSVGPDSQCQMDKSAVQHSCPNVPLGKHLLGTLPFPEGTVSIFWKDQPVSGTWTGLTRCGSLGLVSKYLIILQVLQKLC